MQTNEDGFHIWRYHSSVGWAQIADCWCQYDILFRYWFERVYNIYYAVRAYNSAGVSSWSNIPSATTLGQETRPHRRVPTGLNATAASCSQVNLSWNASTDTGGSGLKGYNVYKNGSYLKQVTTTSTSDTGLNASTSYSYRVSAVDNAGEPERPEQPCKRNDTGMP